LGRVSPFWIPDSEADDCMTCGISFNVVRRRHHCRACGKVVCGKCSAVKFPLLCLEGKQARVCDTCHEIMTQLDLGQNDKMYEESLRYMQNLFEWKSPPSPEEIFECLRTSLEAKSKRERFLESLVEVLTQVWEILTRSGSFGDNNEPDIIRDIKLDDVMDTSDDDESVEAGIDAEMEGEVWARTLADWESDSSLTELSSSPSLPSYSPQSWLETCAVNGHLGKTTQLAAGEVDFWNSLNNMDAPLVGSLERPDEIGEDAVINRVNSFMVRIGPEETQNSCLERRCEEPATKDLEEVHIAKIDVNIEAHVIIAENGNNMNKGIGRRGSDTCIVEESSTTSSAQSSEDWVSEESQIYNSQIQMDVVEEGKSTLVNISYNEKEDAIGKKKTTIRLAKKLKRRLTFIDWKKASDAGKVPKSYSLPRNLRISPCFAMPSIIEVEK